MAIDRPGFGATTPSNAVPSLAAQAAAQRVGGVEGEATLALDMALGEGSGAALALGVLRAALECHDGMATFAGAGVAAG